MSQLDVNSDIFLNKLEIKKDSMIKKFTIVSRLPSNNLTTTLEQIIQDDDWVYICTDTHVTGLFKHEKYYYYYDSDYYNGELKSASIKDIVDFIMIGFRDSSHKHKFIGIYIFGPKRDLNKYPEKKELLENIFSDCHDPKLYMETLTDIFNRSIIIGCLETLQFLIDKCSTLSLLTLAKNELNKTGIITTVICMSPSDMRLDIIKALLLIGVDPNIPLKADIVTMP
ncbi:MAG TPA: hypothetical protein DEA62_03670, partial [Coxiellaceae bacterium]|nr:hypothetical protein [Coxiellaceae bacterium]